MKQRVFGASMLLCAATAGGLASVAGITHPDATFLQLFYWHLLPAFPFVLLFAASFRGTAKLGLLIGAAAGATTAIALPVILLWHDSRNYHGGGANIGLALVYLALPIYLPFFMLVGGYISHLLSRHPTGANPALRRPQ